MRVIALPWVDLECGPPAPALLRELSPTTERRPGGVCHRWVPALDGVARRYVCTVCGARCRRDPHGKIIAFALRGVRLDAALRRELGVELREQGARDAERRPCSARARRDARNAIVDHCYDVDCRELLSSSSQL